MKYKLRILKRAEADAREIFDWIYERSPAGARTWFAAFERAANKLLRNPYAWPLAPENKLVSYEVRHFVFKTRRGLRYRAIYTVVDDEVRILHVRGSGQNVLEDLGQPNEG